MHYTKIAVLIPELRTELMLQIVKGETPTSDNPDVQAFIDATKDVVSMLYVVPAHLANNISVPNPTYMVALMCSTIDVKAVAPHLSEDQALQVLLRVKQSHDMEYGVNYDTLYAVARKMFPEQVGIYTELK